MEEHKHVHGEGGCAGCGSQICAMWSHHRGLRIVLMLLAFMAVFAFGVHVGKFNGTFRGHGYYRGYPTQRMMGGGYYGGGVDGWDDYDPGMMVPQGAALPAAPAAGATNY